jgi:hypothetical protein
MPSALGLSWLSRTVITIRVSHILRSFSQSHVAQVVFTVLILSLEHNSSGHRPRTTCEIV